MQDMLSTITSYIPHSLIKLLLEHTTPPQNPTIHHFRGAVLFADVSGFTPLTEKLAQKGDEGPEEITRLLNRYFGRMIALIESEGGDVVKFSGDALTVIFVAHQEPLSHSLRRAQQAGEAMQATMRELAPVKTSVGNVDLGLKVGIGAGEVQALQVGGIFKRWEYVITGRGLRQAAEAEGMSGIGDVIIHPKAAPLTHPSPLPPLPIQRPNLHKRSDLDVVELRLRRYVPGAVRSWMIDTEFHNWLGVLRNMSVLFIGLDGIEYNTPEALQQLHEFLRKAQQTIYRYQGSINKLAVDDKGTIFLVLFGAPPFAHSDDPLRAVRCALDLQQVAQSQKLHVKIGVSTGRVFAGPVGSDLRREYTVMGDTVNLAARLMGQAEPNTTRCDQETHRLTHNQIDYTALEPVKLKGKAEATPIFLPKTLLKNAAQLGEGQALIGRQDEQTLLHEQASNVKKGQNHVLLLEGESGLGKTLLLTEFQQSVHDRGFLSLHSGGDSLEQMQSYWPWREIFFQLLGLSHIDNQEEQQQHIQSIVERTLPHHIHRLPLLNELLELKFQENHLSKALDSSLRQQSLKGLLVDLILHREDKAPLCLVMENLQWLDSLSWDLVFQLTHNLQAADAGIFFILSTRPMGPNALMFKRMDKFKSLQGLETLSLNSLSVEDSAAVIAARLQIPVGFLPQDLVQLVRKRAGGNPLFIKEVLNFLKDNKMLLVLQDEEGARCQLQPSFYSSENLLPDSLEGLLLARIDKLSPELQLVMKVAAVLGQSFSYQPLCYALQKHTQLMENTIQQQLEELVKEGLTEFDPNDTELTYLFRNLVTQEVAYRTLLHSQRRELHQSVAEWYEEKIDAKENVEEEPRQQERFSSNIYPLLAHHWRYAGNQEQEKKYSFRSAESAFYSYANTEAIQYFSRTLELTSLEAKQEQYEILMQREKLYHRKGQRENQSKELEKLEQLAQELGPKHQAEVLLRKTQYAQDTGAFDQVIELAQQVIQLSETISEPAVAVEANQQWGAALFKLGKVEEATPRLVHTIELAQTHQAQLQEAMALRWLGISQATRGVHDEALKLFERALELHRKLDDRSGEIRALNNIALIHQQRDNLKHSVKILSQSLDICRMVGASVEEAMVSCNLAGSFISLGQYAKAQKLLSKNLLLCRQVDSLEYENVTYLDMGKNSLRVGQYSQAIEHYQNAIRVSQKTGHRYNEAFSYLGYAEALYFNQKLDDAYDALNQAIRIGQAIDTPYVAAHAKIIRGHLDLAKHHHEHALASYQAAAEAFSGMKQTPQEVESKAGIARVYLALQKPEQALSVAQDILNQLDLAHPSGYEEVTWVCLTCIQALQANAKPQSVELLHQVTQLLQERASELTNPELQDSYCNRVAHHRMLLEMLKENPYENS